ncbi:hypothetical protein LZ31DRAFT_553330 [Colletotrichum somersetense]|nr:hypothetical protein LZ31DRAFT_553330 [Colletotrichum somersetense]
MGCPSNPSSTYCVVGACLASRCATPVDNKTRTTRKLQQRRSAGSGLGTDTHVLEAGMYVRTGIPHQMGMQTTHHTLPLLVAPFRWTFDSKKKIASSVAGSAAILGTGRIHAGRPLMAHNVSGILPPFNPPLCPRSAVQRLSRTPLCTGHVQWNSVSFAFIRTNQGGPRPKLPPSLRMTSIYSTAYPPPVAVCTLCLPTWSIRWSRLSGRRCE